MDCMESRRQPVGTVKRSYRCRKCGAWAYSIEVLIRFKERKGKDRGSTDPAVLRAKAKAKLAADILEAQGIKL